ncbi:hypothetical protein A1F94_001844 [Pyrenophora tritici-repentis]|nr:hypothetical protein A1F99_024560 [Pyrenophora tritici-repentis]KAG9388951.1 hypothetical protein A1F94_001844 [Pyrenophora tritici-repentis]KAI0579703.1 hypothetical protein Alg215_05634 [Pyrenophora tritici-repentis]KAI0604832.1 hypothetical protein TUN205_10919 [Pyrenophora tritici-repentis]KAI1599073.1 hypothetical protein PtrCC142_007692 [Pyrenophora tritici-repentis]
MAAGPPLGNPWNVNVGNNPNINREPPPPPIGAPAPQVAPPAAAAAGGAQVIVEQQQAPIYGPPLQIGIGGPGFGVAPGMGLGVFPPFPQHPIGMMDPFLFPGFVGAGPGGGPLAPIRAGSFLPGAHAGIGFGIHNAGIPFPPPPPGAIAGIVPPFAPAAPLWAGGGLAFGNVPAPAQEDVGQIPGGIPPGVMLCESAEHTIFIRITGNICPWLSPGTTLAFEPLAAGSATGLNRVIQICNDGVSEDELENCAVTECIELGSGLWEKGQTFKYNDAVSRVLTMKDAGWDNTRNRSGGNTLHLWGHRV